MNVAKRRTSAAEKFSSSRQRGMSAWICSANLVASPRCSRCESCCGRSAMANRLCRIRLACAAPGSSAGLAPLLDSVGQRRQQAYRVVPAEAAVGDALPECERLSRRDVLAARDEVGLDHHADDALLARADLRADVGGHRGLALVILGGVGVRAVDHQAL